MSDHAIGNAKSWLESIVEDVAALEAAIEQEGTECGQCEGTGEIIGGLSGDGEDEECPVCDGAGEIPYSGEDEDTVRQRIDEGPLSIRVRDGWRSPGAESDGAEEYEILLSTGGPALRIIGELDQGEPYGTPLLQWQDWGTPWTTYHETTSAEDTALTNYVGSFYLGA